MTWSYSLGSVGSAPKDQVRRLIGDVIQTDQQIADEEILFALSIRPTIYGAAADCCRFIAAQFSRKVDVITTGAGGSLKTNYSAQATAYNRMAANFENMAIAMGGGLPYAGGISVTDKQRQETNSDRVAPQFNIGMEDNQLPVGSVGNETNGDMPSEEGQ